MMDGIYLLDDSALLYIKPIVLLSVIYLKVLANTLLNASFKEGQVCVCVCVSEEGPCKGESEF